MATRAPTLIGRLIGEGAPAATANARIVMFLLSIAAFAFGLVATVPIRQTDRT